MPEEVVVTRASLESWSQSKLERMRSQRFRIKFKMEVWNVTEGRSVRYWGAKHTWHHVTYGQMTDIQTLANQVINRLNSWGQAISAVIGQGGFIQPADAPAGAAAEADAPPCE